MSIKWVPTKGPKTKRLAEARLHQLIFMQAVNDDQAFLNAARKEIPEAWNTLEMDVETEAPKQKVTLYLDRAVIAMFRKMGTGYQGRINRILETWMQMKMANKAVFEKEIFECLDETIEDRDRPEVGEKMKKHYKTLLEHWAYVEGFEAAVKKGK